MTLEPIDTVDLLVVGAELVATVDDARREIPGGWVACRDGLVVAIGDSRDVPPAARRTLSATGCLVTPGLVNTHHHLYQNLARAFRPVAAVPFETWLSTLTPMWCALDEEAVYVSAWVGMVELLLGGCTTTTDHLYLHPPQGGDLLGAEIRAAHELSMRFHPTFGMMDITESTGGFAPDTLARDVDDLLAEAERHVGRHHDPRHGSMLQLALAPAATYLASRRLLADTATLAERLDVRLHTHLAYADIEDEWCGQHYGISSVAHAADCGWDTERVWIAHALRATDDDIASFAQWGTSVAHCPSSTMLAGGGLTPVAKMRSAGVAVGLGVDGSASTDCASMWLETRMALLATRYVSGSPACSARDALEMATRGGARCLGREGELGQLAVGSAADLVCWSLTGPLYAGALSDPIEAWLRCGPTAAKHTVVAGRPLVVDGAPVHGDLDDVLVRHRVAATRLQSLAG
jgi:cytosine/adenosine deaminase-related metal-dependent hydrolase